VRRAWWPWAGLAGTLAVLAVLAFPLRALRSWWVAPLEVPDQRAPPAASFALRLHAGATAGQLFVARHNNLVALEVVLAAAGEAPRPRRGRVILRLWEAGRVGGPELRRTELPAETVPQDSIWVLRPGRPGERWTRFRFDPVPFSAGRAYVAEIAYPAGTPDARLEVLSHFYNLYPAGQLYQNGEFTPGGNLLFRTYYQGQGGDTWRGVRAHLLATLPFQPATQAHLLAALAGLGGLALLLLVSLWRLGAGSGMGRQRSRRKG